MIESVGAEYVNIFVYSPLSRSSYIESPCIFPYSLKGLISIKNNDNKCFPWCYIKHLNPLQIHPEKITHEDKNMVNDLDPESIKFHVSTKTF